MTAYFRAKFISLRHFRRLRCNNLCYFLISGLPYVRPMSAVSAVAGKQLYIKCPVAGYPIESIVWEKGKHHASFLLIPARITREYPAYSMRAHVFLLRPEKESASKFRVGPARCPFSRSLIIPVCTHNVTNCAECARHSPYLFAVWELARARSRVNSREIRRRASYYYHHRVPGTIPYARNGTEISLCLFVTMFTYPGDVKLPTDMRQRVANGTLFIDTVQRSADQGTYTCTARNKHNFTSHRTVEVRVLGK